MKCNIKVKLCLLKNIDKCQQKSYTCKVNKLQLYNTPEQKQTGPKGKVLRIYSNNKKKKLKIKSTSKGKKYAKKFPTEVKTLSSSEFRRPKKCFVEAIREAG